MSRRSRARSTGRPRSRRNWRGPVAGGATFPRQMGRLRSLEAATGEGREAEDAVGDEPDADKDHHGDTPGLRGEAAQRAVEPGGVVRVVTDGGPQHEEAHETDADAPPDLADRAEPF